MNKTSILIGIASIGILIGVIFYVKNMANASRPDAQMPQSSGNASLVTPSPLSLNNQEPSPSSPVKAFTVHGANFSFIPNILRAKKGDTVKITFINDEGFHDFVLDDFSVRTKQIKKGEQETVQFVADKTGSFEFYCSVGTHRQMGMKGTLEIIE